MTNIYQPYVQQVLNKNDEICSFDDEICKIIFYSTKMMPKMPDSSIITLINTFCYEIKSLEIKINEKYNCIMYIYKIEKK